MSTLDEAVLVGLMSGTSLDGVTAAIARFKKESSGFSTELLGFETLPYSDAFRERLASAMQSGTASEYNTLAFQLGDRFASAANEVIASAGIARADIAAIASHGHTMWHAPPAGTWQLGEGAVVAERVGIDVIENFRVRDVAAGGEGAPLVPIADAMLFGRPDGARALQNIGGMANVTIVPQLGSTDGVRAFDTGPGVALIDSLTQALVGDRFDRDGGFASMGKPDEAVIARLLQHEFFRREPPKSTGRELFGDQYAIAMLDECRKSNPECNDADVLATATELTARSIALAYAKFVPEPIVDVVVSGGGAKNKHLMHQLTSSFARSPLTAHRSPITTHSSPFPDQTSPFQISLFEDLFFPGEAKEAVAFAFLGFLHLRNEPASIRTATGAKASRVLGKRIPK